MLTRKVTFKGPFSPKHQGFKVYTVVSETRLRFLNFFTNPLISPQEKHRVTFFEPGGLEKRG